MGDGSMLTTGLLTTDHKGRKIGYGRWKMDDARLGALIENVEMLTI